MHSCLLDLSQLTCKRHLKLLTYSQRELYFFPTQPIPHSVYPICKMDPLPIKLLRQNTGNPTLSPVFTFLSSPSMSNPSEDLSSHNCQGLSQVCSLLGSLPSLLRPSQDPLSPSALVASELLSLLSHSRTLHPPCHITCDRLLILLEFPWFLKSFYLIMCTHTHLYIILCEGDYAYAFLMSLFAVPFLCGTLIFLSTASASRFPKLLSPC